MLPAIAHGRRRPAAASPGRWPAPEAEGRWAALAQAITTLAEQRRRSVRIVDADCGDGTLLMRAVRFARGLGFTAIEGRGLGRPGPRLARAQAAAERLQDAAIGVTFECADLRQALAGEAELAAEIVLWRDQTPLGGDRDVLLRALALAGCLVIGLPAPAERALAA